MEDDLIFLKMEGDSFFGKWKNFLKFDDSFNSFENGTNFSQASKGVLAQGSAQA
jgi:hypothetical protein